MRKEQMTLNDIQNRIDHIRLIKGDNEMAHVEEDELHQDVLSAIADGPCEDPAAAARLVLTTSDIKFMRWYA